MKFKLYIALAFIFFAASSYAQSNDSLYYEGDYQNETANSNSSSNKQNNGVKKDVRNPMSITFVAGAYYPMNLPEEKTGFMAGVRYKYSFFDYFAVATTLEYTSGGIFEQNYMEVKAHFLVQQNIPLSKKGLLPYVGIGPSFRTDVAQGTSVMGFSLLAGSQYVWKRIVTGLGIEYSHFPQFNRVQNQSIYASDIKVFFEIGTRF